MGVAVQRGNQPRLASHSGTGYFALPDRHPVRRVNSILAKSLNIMDLNVGAGVIQTERLYLTPLALADAKDVQHLAGDEAIARNALNIPHPFRDGMAEAWIGGLGDAVFAIREGESVPLVGLVGLQRSATEGVAELSYWIGKAYWGRGYATEAAAAVVAYGFERLGLRRIFATSLARNSASGRVLEKVGMREEGVLRQHVEHWGRYEDLRYHGMLEEEHVTRIGDR